MRLGATVLAVIGLAIGAAIAAFLVAPAAIAPTAAIAVYAAVFTTLGGALALRTIVIDRPGLGAEIYLEGPYGSREGEPHYLGVRLYNAGRRPVTVEGLGLWATKAANAPIQPAWDAWGDRGHVNHLPATLGESESLTIYASGSWIATWYLRHDPPVYLFAKPSHGPRIWWELDAATRDFLATAWPKARAAQEAEAAKQAEQQRVAAAALARQADDATSVPD